jgi:hypothetical protein
MTSVPNPELPKRVWIEQFAKAIDPHQGSLIRDPNAIWKQTLLGRAKARPGMPLNELALETLRQIAFGGDAFLVQVPANALISRRGLQERELFICLSGELEVVEDGKDRYARRPVGDFAGEEAFRSSNGRRLHSIKAASSEATIMVVRPSSLKGLGDTVRSDLLDQCLRALSDHSQDAGNDNDQDHQRAA